MVLTAPARRRVQRRAPLPELAAPKRARLPLLDGLRLVASFAVVWQHTRREPFLGLAFGLFLFFVLLTALGTSSERQESLAAFSGRKTRELIVPWLRWSLVWAAILLVLDLTLFDTPPGGRYQREMVLYGGNRHLWFLPFAAVALVFLRPVSARAARWPDAVGALGFALLGAVGTVVAENLLHPPPRIVTLRLWISASPALLYGLALGRVARVREAPRRALLAAGVAAIALGSMAVAPPSLNGQDLTVRHAAAAALACVGFALPLRLPAAVGKWATVTFGVYLVHPMFAILTRRFVDPRAVNEWLHVGAVYAMSAGAIVLLRRLPVRWVELRKRTPVLRPEFGREADRDERPRAA